MSWTDEQGESHYDHEGDRDYCYNCGKKFERGEVRRSPHFIPCFRGFLYCNECWERLYHPRDSYCGLRQDKERELYPKDRVYHRYNPNRFSDTEIECNFTKEEFTPKSIEDFLKGKRGENPILGTWHDKDVNRFTIELCSSEAFTPPAREYWYDKLKSVGFKPRDEYWLFSKLRKSEIYNPITRTMYELEVAFLGRGYER